MQRLKRSVVYQSSVVQDPGAFPLHPLTFEYIRWESPAAKGTEVEVEPLNLPCGGLNPVTERRSRSPRMLQLGAPGPAAGSLWPFEVGRPEGSQVWFPGGDLSEYVFSTVVKPEPGLLSAKKSTFQ